MKTIKTFICLFVVTALCAGVLNACRQEVLSADIDEIEFVFENIDNEIYGGEPISFYVKSKHNKIRFNDFDFPLAQDMVTIGKVYEVSEELRRTEIFRIDEAEVSENQTGRHYISGEIEDLSTGKKVRFQQVYTAYLKSAVRLEILNDVLLDEYGYAVQIGGVDVGPIPTVIDGDDLLLRLKCDEGIKGPVFINSFSSSIDLSNCETNLVINHPYSPDEDGHIDFWFHNVNIDMDRIGDPAYFKMNVTDNSTGRTFNETVLNKSFVTLLDFDLRAEVEPFDFYKGQNVVLRFNCNRPAFVVKYDEGILPISDMVNQSVFVNDEGYYVKQLDNIFGDDDVKTGEYVHKLHIVDEQFTRRLKVVNIPFKVIVPPLPQSIDFKAIERTNNIYNQSEKYDLDISTNKLHINEGEVLTCEIIPSETIINNNFKVSYVTVSGNATVALSAVDEDNYFTVEAVNGGGVVSITVSHNDDQSISKTYSLYVRQVASLELFGQFKNLVTTKNPCSHFRGKKIGYLGIPQSINARLVTHNDLFNGYNGQIDIINYARNRGNQVIPASPVRITLALDIENLRSSPYRLAVWKNYDETKDRYDFASQKIDLSQLLRISDSKSRIDCDMSSGWWLLTGSAWIYEQLFAGSVDHLNNGKRVSNWPQTSHKEFNTVTLSGKNTVSFVDACETLWWMNNNCHFFNRVQDCHKINYVGENSIDLYVYNLEYNKDILYIPYIIYNFGPQEFSEDDKASIPYSDKDMSINNSYWENNYWENNTTIPWWWHKQPATDKGIQKNPFQSR